MALPARPTTQKAPPRPAVKGPNPGAAPMATAQVTTRAATPTKAATSTPAAPRQADPRGNARPSGPNRTGGGSVNVTQPKPYVGGSDRAKAAIAGAVGSIVNPDNWKQGPITDAGKAVAWLGSSSNPINRVGIGPTSNPNAAWKQTQRERQARSASDKAAERVAAEGVRTNRPASSAYPAGPGMPAATGRPAPGMNTQAFRGGVTGSGPSRTPVVPSPTPSQRGAFRGGVGGTTAPRTGPAPTLPNGQQAPAQKPTQQGAAGKPGGKPQQGKPGGKPQQGSPTQGAGANATPSSGTATGTGAGTNTGASSGTGNTPTTGTGANTRPNQQGPFGNNLVSRNIGGVDIQIPSRVGLEGVNVQGIGNSVKTKIQQAGGIKNIKDGTVVGSFKGSAGVPWDITVQGGKVVVVRGSNTPQSGAPATSTQPTTQTSDTGTPTSSAEASATPGQSASDFVTNQLLNNPNLGMNATNNDATAALVALASKTGLAIAGPDGAIVDPNTLLGGDPNKPFDPATLSQYKLVLAHGPSKGQAVTGQNYLDLQVNPDVGGQDTSLIGTTLGNLILKQKQERANLLEQQSQGGGAGGAIGAQQAQAATGRALGYGDLIRGDIGGGLTDIQSKRQQGFQNALQKMLENPEAYGYQGGTPTATASTTPKPAAPTEKKFKVGEVKTWGGKQHRWNGTKWVRIGPAKPAGKK